MRKTFLGISLIFLPLAFISCSSHSWSHTYISSVHDGDTFTNTAGTKFRLFGVDTPEVSDQYHNFKPTKGIEGEFGWEATRVARKLLLHKTVDIKEITTDPYGRHVASFKYKGVDMATLLLQKGLARVAYMSLKPGNPYFTRDVKYYKHLLVEQQKAFKNKVGVWSRSAELIDTIFPKAKGKKK